MNVTLEKTGNLEGRLVVSIVEADYADKVTKALKEIGQKKDIPGFRKGHIDMATLRKRFGKGVKADVLNDIASEEALKYIKDNNLDLMGQPLPAEGQELNLDEKDYTFTYEIGLAPELNMKLDNSVVLDYYNIAVSDEMVKEQDKDMRERAGERVASETYADRALVKGVIKQLNEDGSVKEGGIEVEEGILAPFLFKGKDEAKKFEDSKVGDKVVFDAFATCDGNEAELSSMLHIDRDRVEEAKGNFEITISEFVVVKPAELGQEYYDKVFGADTVHNEEEYFAKVKDIIAQALQPNSRQLFVRTAEDYLMNTYGNMELPKEFLCKFLIRVNEDLNKDNVEEAYNASVNGIKWELIESKAAQLMEVKVTEEDLKAFARIFAMSQLQQYGMGAMAEQMADYYAENLLKDENQRRHIAREAFSGQLFNKIHNAVSLNEKTVSLDEFRTIVAALNATTAPEQAADEAAAEA